MAEVSLADTRNCRTGVRPLLELNADPVLLAPYDAAIPRHLIGVHFEFEFGGNGYRIGNVNGGTIP
jgi:hypothetical protein